MTNYYAPPTVPEQSPAPRKPRWYQKRWPVALIALAVGIGIGAAATGGQTTKTKDVAGPTVHVPGPTVTQTVPGPTVTQKVPGPTVKVPGPTKTIHVPAPAPVAPASFSDGTYLVPNEIKPGLYKTSGPGADSFSGSCYWERDKDLTGGIDSINDNDNISGQTTIQVSSNDAAVKFDGGCTWNKVG